jgi:hypothetical protein
MKMILKKDKGNWDKIKENILRHSNGDIILKYQAFGTEGLTVLGPYAVYNFINDKNEKAVYIYVYASRRFLYDAIRELKDIYGIDIYDFIVEGVRECYD